jgi:hypothetical protein
MKTIKSAQLGNCQLREGDMQSVLVQVSEVIKEHRAAIIARLVNDLPTYLDYKFKVKATRNQLLEIKEKLIGLKNGGVDLTPYQAIVTQLEVKYVVHLTNEPFYVEIDALLSALVSSYHPELFGQQR